jgi:hypothetical protein
VVASLLSTHGALITLRPSKHTGIEWERRLGEQVGTVVRTAEDEAPVGVLSVLNLFSHKALKPLAQILAHLKTKADAATKPLLVAALAAAAADTVPTHHCWVTLRARWVTLRARWVTLRARW